MTGTRRSFRPTLWPTLLVVPALALLIALGTWQLERLQWKTELLQRIETRMAEPPVPLPPTIEDPADWDYRRVSVTGTFMHDAEMHLAARVHDGQAGYHVLTPLRRAGPDDREVVLLVDRGWVPAERIDPASRPASLVEGLVEVTGIARIPSGPGWFTPENDPADNLWYAVDLQEMAAAAGVAGLQPLVLEAGPSADPDALPIGGQTRLAIPNDHLQYALTWYAFALTLAAIYVVYHWRSPGPPRDRRPKHGSQP